MIKPHIPISSELWSIASILCMFPEYC